MYNGAVLKHTAQVSERFFCDAGAQSVPMEGDENEPCFSRLAFILCMLLHVALICYSLQHIALKAEFASYGSSALQH